MTSRVDVSPGAGTRPRVTPLTVLGIVFALVYAPTAAWLWHRWSLGVWYQIHGFFVVPVCAWLAYLRLKETRDWPREASAWGFWFLVPAVLLQVADTALRVDILSATSLALALPGLSLLLLGKRRTKALWFPLLFFAFAIPIPLVLAERVTDILRAIAATGAFHLLRLFGYGVVRTGTEIVVGLQAVEIGEACSGFSTLMGLFVAGLLLAYTSGRSVKRRALMLLCVFPIAALANILRCTILIMLVAAFGPHLLSTWLHPFSGVVTFVLGLLALWAIEGRERRREAT